MDNTNVDGEECIICFEYNSIIILCDKCVYKYCITCANKVNYKCCICFREKEILLIDYLITLTTSIIFLLLFIIFILLFFIICIKIILNAFM